MQHHPNQPRPGRDKWKHGLANPHRLIDDQLRRVQEKNSCKSGDGKVVYLGIGDVIGGVQSDEAGVLMGKDMSASPLSLYVVEGSKNGQKQASNRILYAPLPRKE